MQPMYDPTDPPAVTRGACEGGPTSALTDTGDGLFEECVVCGIVTGADQTEDWVFGFRARCGRRK